MWQRQPTISHPVYRACRSSDAHAQVPPSHCTFGSAVVSHVCQAAQRPQQDAVSVAAHASGGECVAQLVNEHSAQQDRPVLQVRWAATHEGWGGNRLQYQFELATDSRRNHSSKTAHEQVHHECRPAKGGPGGEGLGQQGHHKQQRQGCRGQGRGGVGHFATRGRAWHGVGTDKLPQAAPHTRGETPLHTGCIRSASLCQAHGCSPHSL